jgi:hypothetical protein
VTVGHPPDLGQVHRQLQLQRLSMSPEGKLPGSYSANTRGTAAGASDVVAAAGAEAEAELLAPQLLGAGGAAKVWVLSAAPFCSAVHAVQCNWPEFVCAHLWVLWVGLWRPLHVWLLLAVDTAARAACPAARCCCCCRAM